jgi:hypothetical protein
VEWLFGDTTTYSALKLLMLPARPMAVQLATGVPGVPGTLGVLVSIGVQLLLAIPDSPSVALSWKS